MNIDPMVLNRSNYAIWAPDMETLLKSVGPWLCKYMKIKEEKEKCELHGRQSDCY